MYDFIDKKWSEIAKYMFQYDNTLPKFKENEVAEKIRNFYFPNGETVDASQYNEITKVGW